MNGQAERNVSPQLFLNWQHIKISHICTITDTYSSLLVTYISKIPLDTYAPTMLTLPSLAGFPIHFTRPALS